MAAKSNETTTEAVAATSPATLDSFAEKFGHGGKQTAYLKGRAAKVNKIEELDAFLDEFANNRHKRAEMRRQLIELSGIKEEGEKNGNSN